MSFMNAIKNELDNETCATENGAIGFRTTGKKLLDLNFAVASMRSMPEQAIVNKFMDAYYENPVLAMKWLFYSRDIRGGLGERRLFRVVMKHLSQDKPEVVKAVFKFAPEYGRYDDLWCLLDTPVKNNVLDIVAAQFSNDCVKMGTGSISLLAKWLPSENASSNETKRYAKIIRTHLEMTPRSYRQKLSQMRRYIDVVERKMSAKQWGEIKYEAVPSRANLIYNGAFLRNDEERRREYLGALEKGETKINASTLFPHDIVNRYTNGGHSTRQLDATLEGLWKALPDTVKGAENTIVVADGSCSMTIRVGSSNVSALDVANALAIYFAERSSGEFKDKYITFSSRPQLVDFGNAKTLREKIQIAQRHSEVSDTNIEATFDLILKTAVDNKMSQEDMPKNVLIISDMEFNSATGYRNATNETLFKTIANKYAAHGYKLPRLVFWNVNSRTGTIPVKENDLGVALVSGFSPNVVKMVMSNELDPFKCLLDQLNTERYAPIEEAVKSVV